MTDYEIGYKKTSVATRFKPGQSRNPMGRPPKGKSDGLGEIVTEVLDGLMEYEEKGRIKKATRHEVGLRLLVKRAVEGDVAAADHLLKKRAEALRAAKGQTTQLVVTDWLPDYPGQTGEQKTRDAFNHRPDGGPKTERSDGA